MAPPPTPNHEPMQRLEPHAQLSACLLLMQEAQSAAAAAAAAAAAEAPLSHVLLAFSDNCARAGSSVSGYVVVLAYVTRHTSHITRHTSHVTQARCGACTATAAGGRYQR